MLHGSITLNVGDKVNINTIIGKMGNTGNSTGTHLHLEATIVQTWACANFVDPLTPLGIPNVRGTIVNYGATPTPPIPTIKKTKFNWKIFTRKIRQRRDIL